MGTSLTGKRIIVTGGAGALGQAVVRQLIGLGAECYVPCGNTRHANTISQLDPQLVHAISNIDLTKEDLASKFFADVAANGHLWASIHIVGGFLFAPILDTTLDQFRRQFEMNAVTAFLCSREAIRHFRKQGQGGRILNVTARPALEPRTGSGMIAYTASKSAVATMTELLGEEVAKERIWVNAIAPSIMDTPANRAAMPDAPFDQWVKVEDVASTISFLVSPENNCVRSGLIPVYGGL